MPPQYTLTAPNKNPLEPIINWYETFDAPTIELKQFPDNVHLVETPEALKKLFTQNTADLVLIDSPSGGGKNVAKRKLIAAIAGPDYDP